MENTMIGEPLVATSDNTLTLPSDFTGGIKVRNIRLTPMQIKPAMRSVRSDDGHAVMENCQLIIGPNKIPVGKAAVINRAPPIGGCYKDVLVVKIVDE